MSHQSYKVPTKIVRNIADKDFRRTNFITTGFKPLLPGTSALERKGYIPMSATISDLDHVLKSQALSPMGDSAHQSTKVTPL